MVSLEEKRKSDPGALVVSRCIIDACQPYAWKRENWFPVTRSSPERRARILEKYGTVLKELF